MKTTVQQTTDTHKILYIVIYQNVLLYLFIE